MSPEIRAVLQLLHLASALFMAAPLYMLVIVNERARFKVPPGYNTDAYLESIIRRQPVRCYAYLAVVLVTGVFLFFGADFRWAEMAGNWAVLVKLGAFVVLAGLLSYVHLGIQPKVDAVIAKLEPGGTLPEGERPGLVRLRMRRKKLSGLCLFLVLTEVIMGIRVFADYSLWLTMAFVAAAALFAWRVYKKPVAYGWF